MSRIFITFFAFMLMIFWISGCEEDGSTVWEQEGDKDTESSDQDSNNNGDVDIWEITDQETMCVPFSRTCFGNSVFICSNDGSSYLEPEDCLEGQFCKDGSCHNELCEPNSIICSDEFSYSICTADGSGYGEALSCGAGRYCRAGVCNVQLCEPNELGCIGNETAQCASDGSGWGTSTPCGDMKYCKAGACLDKVCQPNTWDCDGTSAKRQCKADGSGWIDPESCLESEYCQSGSCFPRICFPEETVCEGNAVKTCNDLGSGYGEPVACEASESCIAGDCQPTACTPNSKTCSGNNVLTCLPSGNGYSEPSECPDSTYCEAGACENQVCTPLSRKCNENGEVVTCKSNGSSWGVPTTCGDDTYCSEGYCLNQICEPGDSVCEDLYSYMTCNEQGSGYGDASNCGENKVCISGDCVDQTCEPNSTRCEGNSVVVCHPDGTGYSTPRDCGEDSYCQDGTCHTQVCEPFENSCDGNSVLTCNEQGSGWGDPVPCGDNTYCRSGRCEELLCEPNEYICSDNFHYRLCNNDGTDWGDEHSCPANQYCEDGGCLDQVCEPDERQCLSSTSYRVCDAKGSAWLPDSTCIDNDVCYEGACHDPNDVPDPTIEVSFVRPQPGSTMELTQGENLGILVNAVMNSGSIASVDLLVDGELFQSDSELPYEFDYLVPTTAQTGAVFELEARANGSNGRYNLSEASFIEVRNDPPMAVFTATVSGDRLATVDASASEDRETPGEELEVRWDWENDGTFTEWTTEKVASHEYADYGEYTIAMEVRDGVNQTASTTKIVSFSDTDYVGGEISESTTWYGTIVITGDVIVPNGVTLTVSEGTQVLFVFQDTQPEDGVGDYGITVESGGKLLVEGTGTSPVLFSSYGTDHRTSGAWEEIAISGSESSIEGAVIEYGDKCLDWKTNGSMSDLEVRTCKSWGVRLTGSGASNVSASLLSIHGCNDVGLLVESGSTNYAFESYIAYENGGAGASFQSAGSGMLDGCDISDNGTSGILVKSSQPAIHDCEIYGNGETGIAYSGSHGGSLLESSITLNGSEGIRIENDSNPPTINYNNVHGNSVSGGWRFFSENPSSVLSYSSSTCCGTYYTDPWTAPEGGYVRRLRVTYDENDSSYGNYVSGGIADGSNRSLWSTSYDRSNLWVDLSSHNAQSVKLYVNNDYGSTQSISANSVVYGKPDQGGVEMAVNMLNATVDARFNYWGVFPNALDAVSMNDPDTVNMQGFTGVPYDSDWDRGPYIGGGTIEESVTLSGTIYVTGNVNVASGATLTLEAGTDVQVVRHDQDGDNDGDFSIEINGIFTALGSESNPISIDGYGLSPQESSYDTFYLKGQGSQLEYVSFAHGMRNLVVQSCDAVMDHLTVEDAADIGVLFSNSQSGASLTHASVEGCGNDGIKISGGEVELGYVNSSNNGRHGLFVEGGSANVTMEDSTLRYNGGNGAEINGTATIQFDYCHFGDNSRHGVGIGGQVSGLVAHSNVSFNGLNGFYIYRNGSYLPTAAVNYNNIFSNSVEASYEVGAENTTSVLSWSGSTCCGTYSSSVWTAPNDGDIVWTKVSYDENDSSYGNYVSGGVMNGSTGQILWSSSYDRSNLWVFIGDFNAKSIKVYINNDYGSTQSIQATQTIYAAELSNDIAMTAIDTDNGTIDAKHNWWGGSLDPASLLSEHPVGLVDYSSFTGISYDVGPR